jgi:hypothetical protein
VRIIPVHAEGKRLLLGVVGAGECQERKAQIATGGDEVEKIDPAFYGF